MDKLTAYQVLGLDSNASTEDVKEAYARLSKEYHPEENPEEFQQLHEAYVTLTRGGRRGNHAMAVESSTLERKVAPEIKETDLVFHEIKSTQVEEESDNFDFEESISQAELDQGKKLWVALVQADKELKILFASSNYKKPNKFKEFFGKEEYKEVFFTREFIKSFTQCISQVKLLPELYSYIIDFYRLKRVSFEELDEDLQKMYQAIDRRYNVKKDKYKAQKTVNKNAMLAIIIYIVCLNTSRVFVLFSDFHFYSQYIFTCLIPYVLVSGIGCLIYKSLRRYHSTYFAQAMTAMTFILWGVVQAFVFQYMFDYTDVLVSKFALSLSYVFLCASIDWLFVVGITAFIQSFRKKK